MNQGFELQVPSMLALLTSIRRILKLRPHPVADASGVRSSATRARIGGRARQGRDPLHAIYGIVAR
jgi:hypothetical protein